MAKKLSNYVARLRCSNCGYEDEGVSLVGYTAWQAKHAILDCPICEKQDSMEVAEYREDKD